VFTFFSLELFSEQFSCVIGRYFGQFLDWRARRNSGNGQGKKNPYRLQRVDALKLTVPDWLIRGYLERNEFAQIFGDPGSCKTAIALDWACRIATGLPWCGQTVKPGAVVYVAGEGQRGIRRRLRAWEIRNETNLSDAPIRIVTRPAQLIDPDAMDQLTAAIDAEISTLGAPALIVFDTLSRNFGPGDESKTADMALAIAAGARLQARWESTIVYVHHPGHGDKERSRGGSNLGAALDSDYRTDKDAEEIVRLEPKKTKDGNPPPPRAFRISEVELGLKDDEGQEVTSIVLDETSYEPRAEGGKAGKGAQQTVMLTALDALYAQHCANLETDGRDPGQARVSLEDWRAACIRLGVPKRTVYRNINTLTDQKRVRVEYGFVSLV